MQEQTGRRGKRDKEKEARERAQHTQLTHNTPSTLVPLKIHRCTVVRPLPLRSALNLASLPRGSPGLFTEDNVQKRTRARLLSVCGSSSFSSALKMGVWSVPEVLFPFCCDNAGQHPLIAELLWVCPLLSLSSSFSFFFFLFILTLAEAHLPVWF